VKASENARKLGLCPNRLWNLAIISERKQADLPGLMDIAQHHLSPMDKGHDQCTGDFCFQITIDSTKIEQLHRCDHKRCGLLEFPPALLLVDNGSTAWSLGDRLPLPQGKPYIALSQLWPDDTGIRLEKPGQVNSCLSNYFIRIVERLQCARVRCAGIWWDTISIPTEPKARKQTINAMHKNYADASCTVVHDKYPLQFCWVDDGSPCLAVVFSP